MKQSDKHNNMFNVAGNLNSLSVMDSFFFTSEALSFEELSRLGAVISVPGFSQALRRSVDDGSRLSV